MDELTRSLCDTWASVLGRDHVDPDERPALLGAAPLDAVRFVVEVENRLGLRVPFECFFHPATTVAGMAAVLSGRIAAGAPPQVIVPIQPGGSRPPLLFVHGDEYAMLSLRHFPLALGPDRPLIGLLPERPHRRFDCDVGLAGLVPGLLDAVREVQPAGPYHLCGHSLGGVLAYELAGRLAAEGEEIGWLALVDTQTPDALRAFFADLLAPRNRLRRAVRRGVGPTVARGWQVARRRLGRGAAATAAGAQVDFDHEGATAIYRGADVTIHDLPLDVYVTTDGEGMSKSQTLGWDRVHRGPLARHQCPGDHMSMLAEPNVNALAAMMAARLEEMSPRTACASA